MDLRPLGSTGIMVSPIGLGTVKLGRTQGVKYPNPVRIPTDDEALALLDRARALGVNLIDTAPAYGTSETRLGQLLQGQRDDWVIVTKAGEEFEDGQSRFDFSASAIRASVERSLVRLRTDRVECVLLHSDGNDLDILDRSGAIEELSRLKDEGKIRSFGASTKTGEGGTRAAERCDVVMLTLNSEILHDVPAIARAHERAVGVLIKKALNSGHATDPREAIRFALGHEGVTSLVVGTTNPEHLREAVDAAG